MTSGDGDRLSEVLAAIDAANGSDPNTAGTDGGFAPYALIYGRRMSQVLADFAPDSSEHLKIAVRGQHIERWKHPRGDYPEGRAGYLEWRRDAGRFHAERVSELMQAYGYGEEDREHVMALVRKQGLKRDAEAQTLEDVACLVFMRWYFTPFAAKRSHDDLFSIVAKTARKMSPAGREAALELPLPGDLVPAILSADEPAA